MNPVAPVSPLGLPVTEAATRTSAGTDTAFLDAISQGIARVEADSNHAAGMLARLATDPDVATHDVIMAMEQARLSMQLAAEVRQRLVDAYKELSGMQL